MCGLCVVVSRWGGNGLNFVFKIEQQKKYFSYLVTMTTVSSRIEGHTKVSGPKRLVHSRKIQLHLVEHLNNMVVWFDS